MLATLICTLLLSITLAGAHPGHHVPMLVAHRGASHDAPENTLASFKLGFEQGAEAIEGDFHLTADGQIVAMHDKDLKRTASVERKVVEMSLSEIQQLDVGSWKDARFAAERAPTLAEVLKLVGPGRTFLIEIKCGPEIIPELKRVIDASGVPLDRLRVISFNADVIAASKQAMPALRAYWLTSYKADDAGVKKPTLDEVLATLARTRADGLDTKADLDVLTESFVSALRERGYEFHAWTVNDPDVARRLIELGVDSITTDRPAWLREQLTDSK